MVASIRSEPSRRCWKDFGFHGGVVGHFLVDLQEDLFADDFGGEQAVGQVGEVVVGVEVRAGGHGGGEGLGELLHAVAGGGADHVGVLEGGERVQRGGERQQAGRGDEVDLVEHEPGAAGAAGEAGCDLAHAFGEAGAGVDQQQHEVGVLRAGPGGVDHGAVQAPAGPEDAGGVHQQDLRGAAHEDAEHAEAGGLRLGRDDGEFGAGEAVQQGGFAGVGGAEDGGEAAARGVGHAPSRASRSAAASRSATRLLPAVPVPCCPAAATAMTNTGSCGGPAQESSV